MPPDFPAWFLLAVLGAAVVWSTPKLLAFLVEALADAVVDRLEDRLQPRWAADVDDALETIAKELTTNGGKSVKDQVTQTAQAVAELQTAIEPLVLEYRRRWDPPETPA